MKLQHKTVLGMLGTLFSSPSQVLDRLLGCGPDAFTDRAEYNDFQGEDRGSQLASVTRRLEKLRWAGTLSKSDLGYRRTY